MEILQCNSEIFWVGIKDSIKKFSDVSSCLLDMHACTYADGKIFYVL